MNEKYVAAIGGANIDIHSRLLAPPVLRDSNPGTVCMSAGGVARNIAENIVRLGLRCRLLSAVGKDAFGEHILSSCRKAGIETGDIYLSSAFGSSVYLDINDHEGDMFLASSDMRVLNDLPEDYFEKKRSLLYNAAAILADGNLSEAQIGSLVKNKGDTPLFVDPVSTPKVVRFLPYLEQIDVFKPNRMELEKAAGLACDREEGVVAAARVLIDKGVRCLVVTLGTDGCYYADRTGLSFFAPAPRVELAVSATGAGDAFTAGLVYAFVRHDTPENAVKLAMGCGALAVQSQETIHPGMSLHAVEQYLASL